MLAGVRAYGLEGPLFWLPGSALKVNWTAESPGAEHLLQVTLHRPGEKAAAYQLETQPQPSVISFPAAGCWGLSVNGSEPVWIAVQGARLLGFAASGDLDPNAPDARVREWADQSVALELLNAAAAGTEPVPSGRPGAVLYLAWRTGDVNRYTPAAYYPEADGQPALLAVQKSLLTNDCRDAKTAVGIRLKPATARQLEEKLGDGLRILPDGASPWRSLSASCLFFRPTN